MYITQAAEDNDVIARDLFMRDFLAGKGKFRHYGARSYRTDMNVSQLLFMYDSHTIRHTVSLAGEYAVIADVTLRGARHRVHIRHSERRGGDWLSVGVASLTESHLAAHLMWLGKNIPVVIPPPPSSDKVTVNFLYRGSMGRASMRDRDVTAPSWADISRNYSKAAGAELEGLITASPGDLSNAGRFGVLHGPPGTGKTTFLRALMQAWRDKANFIYIMDPEAFFSSADYMVQVLFDHLDNESGTWNVIICEDAEEFIAPTAKANVGQALSKLLNIGDGLLGQGLQIMFLFTTNAKDQELHPAMVRHGRCFQNTEIPLLTAAEASELLGSEVSDDMSLADVFARRSHE